MRPEALIAFCDYLEDNATVRDVMAYQAARYAPLENFTHDLMRCDSPFSMAERELIATYVSRLNACQFCYGVHVADAESFSTTLGVVADWSRFSMIRQSLTPG